MLEIAGSKRGWNSLAASRCRLGVTVSIGCHRGRGRVMASSTLVIGCHPFGWGLGYVAVEPGVPGYGNIPALTIGPFRFEWHDRTQEVPGV